MGFNSGFKGLILISATTHVESWLSRQLSRFFSKYVFLETRSLALCSTPASLEDLGFSVGVVSLSWFVPIIALGTRVSPLHDLAVFGSFQGSWRGHACIGLGRNKWHFPDFYWYTSNMSVLFR